MTAPNENFHYLIQSPFIVYPALSQYIIIYCCWCKWTNSIHNKKDGIKMGSSPASYSLTLLLVIRTKLKVVEVVVVLWGSSVWYTCSTNHDDDDLAKLSSWGWGVKSLTPTPFFVLQEIGQKDIPQSGSSAMEWQRSRLPWSWRNVGQMEVDWRLGLKEFEGGRKRRTLGLPREKAILGDGEKRDGKHKKCYVKESPTNSTTFHTKKPIPTTGTKRYHI